MAGHEQTPLLQQGVVSSGVAALRARRVIIAKVAVGAVVLALALWLVIDVFHKKHEPVPAATVPPYVCGNPDKGSAGYIKLANKKDDHYFYWFFEAEEDTGKEPLVLWLTGGPGSSSLFALLTENGPCTINADLSTTANPYAWNRNANYIWLEQPTGVGYSFGAPEDKDYDESNVGENIFWFLQGFLTKHPQFQGREFYVTGESYGGHYVPGAGHYIWQQSKQPTEGTIPINLKGIAIGNGLTNPNIQYAYNQDMVYNQYNVSLLSTEQTEQMKEDSVECIALTADCQATPENSTLCVDAQACWDVKLIAPFLDANRDNYDIRRECNHSDPTACDDTVYVRKYLNLPVVREYLNVDPRVPEWLEASSDVYETFSGRDWSMSFHTYVADLLDDGLRVLIYAGDADLMCNWIGNRAWTLALEWKGKDGYNAADERALISHDPLVTDAPAVDAGVVRSFDNFAFARIYDAGHMVPMNQPAVSLELINKFLYGQEY